MRIRYEPTFAGLLSAVAACLRSGQEPEMLMPDLDQLTLLPMTDIATEPGILQLFRRHLVAVLGAEAGVGVFEQAQAAFLSDDEGIGLPIHRYLAAALRMRRDPSGNLLDRDIARVVTTARKVQSQAHAYLGLLRFRQASPELYLADFSPDFHLLPLILPHFCERLPDQPFVIRDLKRDLAALHVPGRPVRIFVLAPPEVHGASPAIAAGQTPDGTIQALPPPEDACTGRRPLEYLGSERLEDKATVPAASDQVASDPFDALWRRYLDRLTIPERRNLKLQRANMPKKYWKYLTERPE